MKKTFLILFLILFQLGTVSLSSGQNNKKTLTIKIMEKSGMNDQIRQIPLLYSSILSQSKDNVPPELFSFLERETVKVWDPGKILGEISKQVENNLDIKTMQGVLTWLESDLGKKITAIEKAGTTPEGIRGMEEYATQLSKSPASKNRLDLVQRFNEANHLVEWDADMTISMMLAISTAINSALPEEKQMAIDMIKKQIEGLRPKMEEEIRGKLIQSNLYIYRTLKDEEFQRYVEFAESESGKRYHQVTFEAFKDAMEKISLDFGKALGGLYKKIPQRDERVASGKILLHLKGGATLKWYNYTEKDERYCTWILDGEFCIKKSDVASLESE